MYKRILINCLLFLGIFLGLALIFNWDYILTQAKYKFNRNQTETPIVTERVAKTEPNQVRIPALSIVAPIKFVSESNEEVFQKALANGVVHYPGTAPVGKVGNAYIFGHSSDLAWSNGNYKTIFALLPNMKADEKIFVSDEVGQEFEYKVIDTKVVLPNDLSVLSQETDGRKLLSLQTSYPVGTALKRFVVIAELVE